MVEVFHMNGAPALGEVLRYPGGEIRVEGDLGQIALVRGGDPEDLVVLAVWANNVRRTGGNPIGLIPYLPAARADHANRSLGFDAAAYAKLINAADLGRVVCVDPHSLVMPGMLNNCSIIDAADLITAERWYELWGQEPLAGVIVPDEGARERCQLAADRLGLPTFQAHKQRDFDSGELSGFSCDPLPEQGSFLVIDDVCDGGGTFRGLADAAGVGRDRLHLWVTHGVFSGKANELTDYYRSITTTDSHPGCRNIPARVVELLPYLLKHISRVY